VNIMNDARSRFFDNMERELLEQAGTTGARGGGGGGGELEIDFSVTESGRTVVVDSHRSASLEDYPCDSLRTLEDIREETTVVPNPTPPPPAAASANAGSGYQHAGAHPANLEDYPCDSLRTLDGVAHDGDEQQQHRQEGGQQPQRTAASPSLPPPPARSIPVPKPKPQNSQPAPSSSSTLLPSSQPSSHGSSGSAFLNSVLNQPGHDPHGQLGGGGGVGLRAPPLLSHTPPSLSASYEHHHFGKRMRAGSVSGRLRSASELFEEKQLDRGTKLLLKDLILIGDEQVQEALDQFESTGDSSLLEQMIESGMLQHRVPPDLDLLDDLDMDFLNVHEDIPEPQQHLAAAAAAEPGHGLHPPRSVAYGAAAGALGGEAAAGQPPAPNPQTHRAFQTNMVTPLENDDGIGDFEFNEFANDYYSGNAEGGGRHAPHHSHPAASLGTSPPDTNLSEYERRMRSNSLFSALLNEKLSLDDAAAGAGGPAGAAGPADRGQQPQFHPSWLGGGYSPKDAPAPAERRGIQIKPPAARRSSPPGGGGGGGIAESLLAAAAATNEKEEDESAAAESDPEEQEKQPAQKPQAPPRRRVGRTPKDKRKDALARSSSSPPPPPEEERAHVPGSGLPRPLTDPSFRAGLDALGLRYVERPEGWVGAYSPESRKVRVDRFLAKRGRRVWSKTIKYDVRKNFADSRLRVKGRFVRKEDESLMRELMSLT
jgi:hypothetical protein